MSEDIEDPMILAMAISDLLSRNGFEYPHAHETNVAAYRKLLAALEAMEPYYEPGKKYRESDPAKRFEESGNN